MIVIHRYSPPIMGVIMLLYLALEYAIALQTSTSYIDAIAFSAGLNTFQADQLNINRKMDN